MWSENGIKLRIVSLPGGWGGYGFFPNEFTLGTLGKLILKKIP